MRKVITHFASLVTIAGMVFLTFSAVAQDMSTPVLSKPGVQQFIEKNVEKLPVSKERAYTLLNRHPELATLLSDEDVDGIIQVAQSVLDQMGTEQISAMKATFSGMSEEQLDALVQMPIKKIASIKFQESLQIPSLGIFADLQKSYDLPEEEAALAKSGPGSTIAAGTFEIPFTTNPPSMDGNYDPAEWDGALIMDMTDLSISKLQEWYDRAVPNAPPLPFAPYSPDMAQPIRNKDIQLMLTNDCDNLYVGLVNKRYRTWYNYLMQDELMGGGGWYAFAPKICMWYDLGNDGTWSTFPGNEGAYQFPTYPVIPWYNPGTPNFSRSGSGPGARWESSFFSGTGSRFVWPHNWTRNDYNIQTGYRSEITPAGANLHYAEAAIDMVASHFKAKPGDTFGASFSYHIVDGNNFLAAYYGTFSPIATWDARRGYGANYQYNPYERKGPTPLDMDEYKLGSAPGPVISNITMDDVDYLYNVGDNFSITFDGMVSAGAPSPQTINIVLEMYGPEPSQALVQTAPPQSVTLTNVNQTFTLNYSGLLAGLTPGYYVLKFKYPYTNQCILDDDYAFQVRILVVAPGTNPCVVWSGDVDNNGVCNMGDHAALQKYIFDANLNMNWLNGPIRMRVGDLDKIGGQLSIFDWVGVLSQPWYTPLGCYMDADGNGRVNNFDMFGINFNLGRMHPGSPKGGNRAELPAEFILSQNFPNPFNPSTDITYVLPEASTVRIVVTDIYGREVAELVNSSESAGHHTVTFNADNLASGLYFYTMHATGVESGRQFVRTMKMTLSR